MTHGERLLLIEAANAGWHGAKAREVMAWIDHSAQGSADVAYYHARMAARAALRAINAIEDDEIAVRPDWTEPVRMMSTLSGHP